jgi:nitrate reductase cytochrome c-type subunit
MKYPYIPSEEQIKVEAEEIKQRHFAKMQASRSKKSPKQYCCKTVKVPNDTRPVVGTRYQ